MIEQELLKLECQKNIVHYILFGQSDSLNFASPNQIPNCKKYIFIISLIFYQDLSQQLFMEKNFNFGSEQLILYHPLEMPRLQQFIIRFLSLILS